MTSQLLIILLAFFLQFTDKAGSRHIALSEVAIEKRIQRQIAIDSLDYAVSPVYIDSLERSGVHIYHTSRWMNGATIETDSNTIQRIAQWTFVDTVYLTRQESNQAKGERQKAKGEKQEGTWLTDPQTEQLNLIPLHEAGFHGQGITMAIVDGGFQHVDTLSAFNAVRQQILGVYDLTDDTAPLFRSASNHGTKCFGTIAALTNEYHGTATAAYYYLIRSEEHLTESPKEMDNWVAAIELADSLGVDILSSSLGYAMFDEERFTLTYADMDGKSTRCTQAARIATRKGMLVVVAAGNEGDNPWHYISAPADADSILTVGTVDSNDTIATFSSWGPTADGRIKPEVCAWGRQTALIHPENSSVIYGNGTSFACPLIAGMAACLWSALPYATNMEIRERIIQSADRYLQPHNQYGYGIPNAWQAYTQTTDIESIHNPQQNNAQKLLINGRLKIIHQGEVYNIMGYKLK